MTHSRHIEPRRHIPIPTMLPERSKSFFERLQPRPFTRKVAPPVRKPIHSPPSGVARSEKMPWDGNGVAPLRLVNARSEHRQSGRVRETFLAANSRPRFARAFQCRQLRHPDGPGGVVELRDYAVGIECKRERRSCQKREKSQLKHSRRLWQFYRHQNPRLRAEEPANAEH